MKIAKGNRSIFKIVFFGVALFVVLMGVIVGYLTDKPLYFYFRDITATMEVPHYIGFVSQFTNMMWAILTGICFYNFYLMKNSVKTTDITKFYFWSFILVLLLTVDDVFLFHEEAMYSIFGIRQKYIYGFYFLFMLVYLSKFYKFILKTDYIFFLIAVLLFGSSIIVDYVVEIFHLNRGLIVLEDGFKLFGIVSWTIYFTNTAINEFTQK